MADRLTEVYSKLALVQDPELDQSLTELGFISKVDVEDSQVRVLFRLPTYWCSPNFAYLMAYGIRDRVKELNWVSSVTVLLEDHCTSKEINEGLAVGRSFEDIFAGKTDGDLAELRKTFDCKAFISRQERLLRELLKIGFDESAIVRMTVGELKKARSPEITALVDRYLAKRVELGLPSAETDRAFTRDNGESIRPEDFFMYLREARRSRISLEFNANYCRGLLETRYKPQPDLVQIESRP